METMKRAAACIPLVPSVERAIVVAVLTFAVGLVIVAASFFAVPR